MESEGKILLREEVYIDGERVHVNEELYIARRGGRAC